MAACEAGVVSHDKIKENSIEIYGSDSLDASQFQSNKTLEFSDKFTKAVTNNKSLDLIYEVRKFACLWDHSNSEWKDTPKKKVLWKHLAAKLDYKDGKYYLRNDFPFSATAGLQICSMPISTGYQILKLDRYDELSMSIH